MANFDLCSTKIVRSFIFAPKFTGLKLNKIKYKERKKYKEITRRKQKKKGKILIITNTQDKVWLLQIL